MLNNLLEARSLACCSHYSWEWTCVSESYTIRPLFHVSGSVSVSALRMRPHWNLPHTDTDTHPDTHTETWNSGLKYHTFKLYTANVGFTSCKLMPLLNYLFVNKMFTLIFYKDTITSVLASTICRFLEACLNWKQLDIKKVMLFNNYGIF